MRHPHGILTLRREDGRVVCERVRVADTWVRRLRGALFRRTLPSDQGCVLRPSFSIHTMFMQFPIDVVFLDQDLEVLKIAADVRPFHTAACRGAREVVELRAGECERRGLKVGDRVAWASYQAAEPDVPIGTGLAATPQSVLGPILVASRDARFAKLVRFLLDTRGVECLGAVNPDGVSQAIDSGPPPTGVVFEIGAGIAAGLAEANAARAHSPHIPFVLAGEPDVVARAPAGVRIYDKWDETEALIDSVVAAVRGPVDG
jgi:uncharacterized membrane protein (UPF0127 family)